MATDKLLIKIQVYTTLEAETAGLNLQKQAKYLGEQHFLMSEIHNQGAYCTKALTNEKNKKLAHTMGVKRTALTVRYEEIEQTNSIV